MKRTFLWIGLLVLISSMGCAHGLDRGTEALQAEDFDRAESIARGELEKDRDSPWANLLLAETLAAQGDYRQALAYARRADRSEAFPTRSPRLLGQIYTALNRPIDASEAYRRARTADPESVADDLYIETLLQGIAYAAVRRDNENEWIIRSWLAEIAPDHPEADPAQIATTRRAHAIDLRQQGEYLAAIELLEQAVDGDPRYLSREALELGEIYARLNMDEDAADAWELYLSADTDDDELRQRHLDVAEVAARHELYDVAIDALQRVVPLLDPMQTGTTLLELASYQLRAGEPTEAHKTFNQYLESAAVDNDEGEYHSTPYRRAADLALSHNQNRIAITILERGINEAAPDRTLTRQLADIYARRAQLDAVERTLNHFVDRYADTADALLFAGTWARERNNYELARHFFERATELDDSSPDLWLDLAGVLAELEEHDEMIQAVYTYLAEQNESDQAIQNAAELLASHRHYEDARPLLQRLFERQPENRIYAGQLADLYNSWARPADAASVWERWIDARGQEPADIEQVAQILHHSGDMERATQFFRRAGEAGRTQAWLRAADIYFYQDHQAAMVQALDAYLESHTRPAQALEEVATRYRRAGMTARHIDTLTRLAELRPDAWRTHQTLSGLLLDEGRNAEAFAVLTSFVENSSDTVEALEMIGSRLSSRHSASWLIDFYRPWTEGDDVHPTMWRLMGDAYYSLSYEDAVSDGTVEEALRQSRAHYMRFLDETEGQNEDWRGLARDWSQRRMWRPSSLAYERYIEGGGLPQVYSIPYAETLLRLGEPEEAEKILSKHYQSQNRRPDIGTRIARLLQNFHRYEAAEEYARELFLSGSDDATIEGFLILVEILRQAEEFDRLDELVAEFPERSSNRTRARRLTINVLENQGRWAQAASQLDRFRDTVIDQIAFQRGLNYYRAGDPSASFEAFEEAVVQSPTPERTWLEAAIFYDARGATEEAGRAFDLAIQAAPDDVEIRTARGLFLIRSGDLDGGWEEYEFGLRTEERFTPTQRQAYFETLVESGHYDRARIVASHIDRTARQIPSVFDLSVGAWDLRSQDPATVDNAIERLHARSWGLSAVISYLEEAGHQKESHRLIIEEFDEGDPGTASIMLLNNAHSMVRISDWNTQREYLRAIVDPLQRSDTRLIGAVGDHRSRSGQLADARPYLQAAVDHQADEYRPQLAHTLLVLGERAQAMEQFEAWLLDGATDPEALESVLLRFELAGDPVGAARFLDRLVEEPSLLHLALPQKIHYDLERHGDPDRAVDHLFTTLQDFQKIPSVAFRSNRRGLSTYLSKDEIINTALVRSLETIASLGHLDRVEEVLAERDLSYDQHRQLDSLRLKLALSRGELETAAALADEILSHADGSQQRQNMRLDLARRFLSFGVDEPARELVDQALRDQSDFRSHRPFVLHLGLLLIAGQRDDLMDEINAYLARVPNRIDARETLIDELKRMGRDKEALVLAKQAVELTPTADILRRAIIAALNEGDARTALDFTKRFIASADEPFEDLSRLLFDRLPGSEPQLVLPIVEEIRRSRPANFTWAKEHIRLLLLQGTVVEARELMLETLQARNFDRDALAVIVEMLSREHFDVELARVLADEIPAENHWPKLLIRIAEAEYGMGFPDRAQPWLERLDEMALDPELWRLQLADRLATRHLYGFIEPVIAEQLQNGSTSPHALYLQALVTLSAGEGEAGVAEIRRANEAGVGRLRSHYHGLHAALQSGQSDAAIVLMRDLTEMPTRDTNAVSLPLQIALRSAMNEADGPATIRRFLEEERPRLVDGHGATWTQFAGQLAGAFERTDDAQGAYGFYRDRIWQSLFNRDNDRALPIYLNNLAYTYSTTNQHIDRGIDKIYRAIVLSDARNSSYIDTLAWLLYRQGEPLLAEAEVRRALRTFDGPPSGLRELYIHLEQILNDRGIYDQAAWLDTHLHRLPVSDIDW